MSPWTPQQRTQIDPAKALIGLLAAIRDRKVSTNEYDGRAYLEVPGSADLDVSRQAWTAERAGWCTEPADSVVWELTTAGREVLDRGAP